MFDAFIDDAGRPIPAAKVVQQVVVGGQTVAQIISPTVVHEARLQFNCSALDGARLELAGGDGSANSHWEYNMFQVCGGGG